MLEDRSNNETDKHNTETRTPCSTQSKENITVKCNANEISAEGLEELIRQCASSNQNNKAINAKEDNEEETQQINDLGKKNKTKLPVVAIGQVEGEAAEFNETDSESVVADEEEIQLLNKRIISIEC